MHCQAWHRLPTVPPTSVYSWRGAALLFLVAQRLGLSAVPSALAAALWAFNFHGINMALLWVSGRTALLLTCAALASTLAVLSGRMMIGGVLCLLAMLSKEEAVVLPFLLTCWLYRVRRLSSMWPLFAALGIYLVFRLQSGAFWPSTAPNYYQLTMQPSILLRNALEYLDRGATCAAAAVLMVAAAAHTRPILTAPDRRILALGALWFASGYAITVFVPVRSSLYAVFPSIGACIAAAVVVAALMRQQADRTLRILVVSSVIPLLLVPVYRARNVRWVAPADLVTCVGDKGGEADKETGAFRPRRV
jgi:hypothetical protein